MCNFILCFFFFFVNDTATTEIYTLSLHDALPIYRRCRRLLERCRARSRTARAGRAPQAAAPRRDPASGLLALPPLEFRRSCASSCAPGRDAIPDSRFGGQWETSAGAT